MAADYATLIQLKNRPRITDTDDDDLLNRALAAASRGIDNRCGRRFDLDASATAKMFNPRDRVVRHDDGDLFLLPDIGSATGLVVEVGRDSSWTTISASNYETYPDNALADSWPIEGLLLLNWPISSARTRLRVTARWGWPTVPDAIVEATLIQASRLFARKDSPEGVMGSADWGGIRVSRVDPDVEALIQPYAKPGFA